MTDGRENEDIPLSEMTLMDHFAGLAMQALILRDSANALDRGKDEIFSTDEMIACDAYVLANAMMEQRK